MPEREIEVRRKMRERKIEGGRLVPLWIAFPFFFCFFSLLCFTFITKSDIGTFSYKKK